MTITTIPFPENGTRPVWLADGEPLPHSGPLPATSEADVCVVGAGIAGLTIAYCLAREGKRVVVVDARAPGAGETGRTTAHLAWALDDRFERLVQLHGEEGARLAGESHAAAIDWIERTVAREAIDCGFCRVDGYLFLGQGHQRERLEREQEAIHRAGLAGVEPVDALRFGGVELGPALRFPRQGQLHPLRYLGGLARAFLRLGGRLHGDAHVDSIEGGERARVVAGDRTVIAQQVVVATNSPVNTRLRIHAKQAQYRSYVVALAIRRGALPRALLWDTEDPYHYLRLADMDAEAGEELLVVGGEDHKTGQEAHPEARWERLEAWVRARFPEAGRLHSRWSGQIVEPADSLAYIGRAPHGAENVFIATGDSGHGMTHGTIAGILLTDLILGRPSPWAELYDPRRLRLRSLGTFARENLNTAAQYADWVGGGEIGSAEELAPGEGGVMRRGLRHVALYRDIDGECHAFSATCPHLGGVVSWNAAEQTWDCPCHGSRFDALGHQLNGPAISDLSPLDETSEEPAAVRAGDEGAPAPAT